MYFLIDFSKQLVLYRTSFHIYARLQTVEIAVWAAASHNNVRLLNY
jgi:hypothetical protein